MRIHFAYHHRQPPPCVCSCARKCARRRKNKRERERDLRMSLKFFFSQNIPFFRSRWKEDQKYFWAWGKSVKMWPKVGQSSEQNCPKFNFTSNRVCRGVASLYWPLEKPLVQCSHVYSFINEATLVKLGPDAQNLNLAFKISLCLVG